MVPVSVIGTLRQLSSWGIPAPKFREDAIREMRRYAREALDDIEAADRAQPPAPLKDGRGWQEIAKAPRDDVKRLFGCFHNGTWYETLGRYKKANGWNDYPLVPTGFRDHQRPTHFMERPDPPADNKGASHA